MTPNSQPIICITLIHNSVRQVVHLLLHLKVGNMDRPLAMPILTQDMQLEPMLLDGMKSKNSALGQPVDFM